MDLVSPMTVVGAIGALAALVAGFVITLANRGSETVVLGFAAMAAALVLFVLQLFFQLRATAPTTAGVGTQIIINLTSPSVIPLHASNGVRADLERRAVEWLSTTSPRAFENPNKLGRDLAAFSILNFFINAAVDWRMTTTAYRFPAMGRDSVITFFDYQPGESVFALSEGDLRAALRAGGNVFADGPLAISSNGLRLPRGTTFSIGEAPAPSLRTTLTLRNAISRLDFVITPAGMVTGPMRPPAPGQGVALGQGPLVGLPDSLYAVELLKISIQASFDWKRAHHPDVPEHRAWVDRIQQGLADWFKLAA